MPSEPSPTSSVAVLTVAAAFATAAGIAYYSSPSSSSSSSSTSSSSTSSSSSSSSSSSATAATTVGSLVWELLRALKAEESTTNQQPKDETALAYASWLEQEETRESDNGYNPNHERWMCETIDNALRSAVPSVSLSTVTSTLTSTSTVTSTVTSSIPPTPGSSTLRSRSEPVAALLPPLSVEGRHPQDHPRDQEHHHPQRRQWEWDTLHRSSFPALLRAVETLVRHEPEVRERFFGGTLPDHEVHHVYSSSSSALSSSAAALSSSPDDWIHQRRQRSVSVSSSSTSTSSSSSSSSSSSGSLSASSSSSCCTDDFLVEDEHEVERLLRYLRFVEMAGHQEDNDNDNDTDNEQNQEQEQKRKRRRKRSPSISDADGRYEILDKGSVEVMMMMTLPSPSPSSESVVVGYLTAVHTERKEVVLSLNYATDRLRKVLAKSLRWQNQTEDLDRVVDRVWEDVLSGYLLLAKDNSSSSLSSSLESMTTTMTTTPTTTTMTTAARVSSLLSSGYTLVVCGHSLGATLACRLGAASGEQNPSLAVRVYAFGPPPCLVRNAREDENDKVNDKEQHPTATTTATTTSITFVVNNHDCIPRWTPSNLVVLSRLSKHAKRSRFHHFRRYYQARCPVPSFWFSSREWSRFWKNESSKRGSGSHNRGRNHGHNHSHNHSHADTSSLQLQRQQLPRLMVPERVVCLWNHSRDPSIIGAKVHRPKKSIVGGDGFPRSTHHVLGRLWPDRSMFHDHTLEAYKANLELLLEQVANTI